MKQSQNAYRLLNANELHMLEKFGGFQNKIETESLWVSYEHLDEFIVCVVFSCIPGTIQIVVWRGVSRRSMYDKPNHLKGEALAFKRAILKSRPVVI